MLRLLGMSILCVSIASIGFLMCEKMRYIKKYLELYVNFSSLCIQDMRCNNCSVFELFSKYGSFELEFLKDLTSKDLNNPNMLIKRLKEVKIDERDIPVITDFLIHLGNGDIRTETEKCEFFSEKFISLLHNAETEFQDKGRLNKTLFMFLGAGLFIILF